MQPISCKPIMKLIELKMTRITYSEEFVIIYPNARIENTDENIHKAKEFRRN